MSDDALTLALATATPQVSVALGSPAGLTGEITVRQGRRHGEVLAPAIESLMKLTGASLGDVGRLVVDGGPGLFTGLRVGVATAKALASALDVPVVACSSLDALAYPHRDSGCRVASVVDARRGEVFWAWYEAAGGPRPGAGVGVGGLGGCQLQAGEARVSSPAELCSALAPLAAPNGRVLATGDGARRYAGLLAEVAGVEIAGPEHDHPRAAVLLELADGRPAVPADKITPMYLRGADVRIGWEERDG